MSLKTQRRNEIKQYLLLNLRNHPKDIVRVVQEKFNLSRTAILRYMRNLEEENQIEIEGSTKDRKYSIIPIHTIKHIYEVQEALAEDKIWRDDFLPSLGTVKKNVLDICNYGFTEIFNNALEHSEGTNILARVTLWIDQIEIMILDDGVGIFNKIQRKYHLDDQQHAILELSKGKMTTEPDSHTGEGIFFTSKMFDSFFMVSGKLGFTCQKGFEFNLLAETEKDIKGTNVKMEISSMSEKTEKSIFAQYGTDEYRFDQTIVPVKLARYGSENLISRSQAKRLLAHLDGFKVVRLDFRGVTEIGRAFADEIFRVFVRTHPGTEIVPINGSKKIGQIIKEIKEE